MPQSGFHGLFGLAIARAVVPRVPAAARPAAAGAIVLGAMLPDIDAYPTAVAVLMGHGDLIYEIHRTATHSIAAVLALLMASLFMRTPSARWVALGLTIGVASHELLDLFFWFAQIDIFWPLSRLSATEDTFPIVDLWANQRPLPTLLLNLREALEFAAFALMFRALRRIAGDVYNLKRWETAAWIMLGITTITAILFRDSERIQNYFVTTPYLLLFVPYCWSRVWGLRHEIAGWGERD